MKPKFNPLYFSGTSNVVLPVPNKKAYPLEFQDKSRLSYYASLFNSVEINSSFYKVPMASTIQKWADSVPGYFYFTFKLWREISHKKDLNFSVPDVHHFMRTLNHIGRNKGCLLIQFPPGLKSTAAASLESLLQEIQQNNIDNTWKVAVEFRNPSWYREEVYALIGQYGATVVLQDMPASANVSPDTPGELIYLRFHGPNGGYRGSYSDDFLYEYAQYIYQWMEEKKEVYVYFNNTMGNAIKNLVTLNKYVNKVAE
ncbi:MAG: DUF72 domain-containing protein [Sphingobacteriaceae bacterium]